MDYKNFPISRTNAEEGVPFGKLLTDIRVGESNIIESSCRFKIVLVCISIMLFSSTTFCQEL